MSRYKAYEDYKTSRGWLNSIPSHWKLLPLKYLTSSRVTDGPHETPEFIAEGIPFLSVDSIQNNQLVFEGCRFISIEDHERYSVKCKPMTGDVLLGKAASVGKVAHVDVDMEFNVWSPLAVIKPRCSKTGRFIYYSLQSAPLQMQCDMYSNANTQKNLGMSTIDNLSFACPTDDEAEKIAAFLDHETAKIDALIEKQQRLIELLKEKRQAVISHAVTKGLNPKAPMKDSGVEWLGEVPAHWHICRVKNIAKPESGHTPDKKIEAYWVNCDIPWVSLNDSTQLKVVDYISDTAFYLNEKGIANSSARKLPARCVVFTRDASIGLAAITTRVMAVSQHVIAWICDEIKVLPEYLLLVFYAMKDELERYTFGATLKTIGMADVNKLVGVFPGIVEQKSIIDHVFNAKEKLDISISKVEAAIQLSIERRTALISAAVTGKIDVRDWQATVA